MKNTQAKTRYETLANCNNLNTSTKMVENNVDKIEENF